MFDLHSCCVDSCAVEEAWSSNFEARQRGGQRCRYHPTFTPWGLPPRGVDDEDDDGHCRHEELMRKMLMGMVTTIQELLLPSFASDIAVVFLWSVMNHQMILNVVGEQVLIAVIIVLPLLHLKVLNTLSCSTTLMSDGPGQRGKKLKHNWNPDLLQKWSSISEKIWVWLLLQESAFCNFAPLWQNGLWNKTGDYRWVTTHTLVCRCN